jgi:hypothetical protein
MNKVGQDSRKLEVIHAFNTEQGSYSDRMLALLSFHFRFHETRKSFPVVRSFHPVAIAPVLSMAGTRPRPRIVIPGQLMVTDSIRRRSAPDA